MQIDAGISHLYSDVRGELLQRVKAISPEAFEALVLKLLGALRYGFGPEARQGVQLGPAYLIGAEQAGAVDW